MFILTEPFLRAFASWGINQLNGENSDFEVTITSVVRMLTLAIHDDEPNHLLTARRLLNSISVQNLSNRASIRAVNHAQQLIDSYISSCLGNCEGSCGEKIIH